MGQVSPPGGPASARSRRILAWGGHDFTAGAPDRAVCEFMLSLLPASRPRVCLLPTAGGDPSEQIARFYRAFGERDCEPSDLSLFRLGKRPVMLEEHLLAQDLIYVGGGSLLNLLAVWDAHGISAILRRAWEGGTLIAGQSAGAMCWFEEAITKSSGRSEKTLGLGLLPGSLCVHYHQEPDRRTSYLALVRDGMAPGYGLDDHAGLLWEGRNLAGAISARRGAAAYRVERRGGFAAESRLPARPLHDPEPQPVARDIAEFRRVRRAFKDAARRR